MDYLPWVEKYRPVNMDDIMSHQNIMQTFLNLIDKNNNMPHCLFYGPPGTGKTSAILTIARYLYGTHFDPMVLELNASDDRGIGIVRDKIISFVQSSMIYNKTMRNSGKTASYKLVILDEADALTSDAQAGLRRVIEKYTYNSRFCLICNHIKKIIPALQSRCVTFKFKAIGEMPMRQKIQDIVVNEQLDITQDGYDTLVKMSNGDLRKCINVLQITHMAFKKINQNNIYSCMGYSDKIEDVIQILNNPDIVFKDKFKSMYKIITENNISLNDLVTRLSHQDLKDMKVLIELSNIENNLTFETNIKIQLAYLICFFSKNVSPNT